MAFTHLTVKQLNAIKAAFKSADISYDYSTRLALFSGIPSSFFDNMRNAQSNVAQLASDLKILNTTQRYEDQVPLAIWLKNASDTVFAGRIEVKVFEQTLEDLATHPDQRPDTGVIDELFTSLREKIQDDPAASLAVSLYRRVFDQALREIALITDYKDLHEHLHTIQLAWPDEIDGDVRRAPDNPGVRLSLRQHSRLLTNMVAGLKTISERGNVKPEELKPVFGGGAETQLGSTWVEELDYHQAKFDEALNDDNYDLLLATFDVVKCNLATALSNLNDQLKDAVDKMHLKDLIDALSEVCMALTTLDPEHTAEQVKSYESGINELTTLGQRLRELRKQHDDWQLVDTQLGMLHSLLAIAVRRGQAGHTLADIHDALVEQIEPVYKESAANWALDLKKTAKQMKEELDKQDEAAAAAAFQTYRSYANLRFFMLDSEMKAQCDALGKVGQRLRKINDDLENM